MRPVFRISDECCPWQRLSRDNTRGWSGVANADPPRQLYDNELAKGEEEEDRLDVPIPTTRYVLNG
jgi:hypothetical protein